CVPQLAEPAFGGDLRGARDDARARRRERFRQHRSRILGVAFAERAQRVQPLLQALRRPRPSFTAHGDDCRRKSARTMPKSHSSTRRPCFLTAFRIVPSRTNPFLRKTWRLASLPVNTEASSLSSASVLNPYSTNRRTTSLPKPRP